MPNPNNQFPNTKIKSLCFTINIITKPKFIIDDYNYYDNIDGVKKF